MKKILTIVALSLVGLLVVTTIVLGFIPSNFAQVSVDNSHKAEVYVNNKYKTYYDYENSDVMDKLKDLFDEQSKQSVLKSLFTGAYSNDPEVINETTNMSTKLTSGNWIIYYFEEAQILYINGKEYEDKTQSTTTTVTFEKLALSVTETDGMELVTMYIFDTDNNTATHTLKVYADLTDTLSYVMSLKENDELK